MGGGVEANIEDFAQEALIKITGNLDSFRGERAVSPPGPRRSP
jgi:DNA-directed RNA polymerase specialized sigma24 family protein